MSVQIVIEENGCKDKEMLPLGTQLPYFCEKVRFLFVQEPEEIQVIFIKDKEEFCRLKGGKTETPAFTEENKIYIYVPSMFGVATSVRRECFYETLCREVVYLFYLANQLAESS